MRYARVAVALAVGSSSTADAGHDHGAPTHAHDETRITASIGALAATYRSRLFEGDYQGGTFGASVSRGRFELGAASALYQIDRNGKTYRGFGDLTAHGAATLLEHDALVAGAHLMMMAPAGDDVAGLGMGHWMVMPAVWAVWSPHAYAVSGSIGYARGLGDADVHAAHNGGGGWPLVDPMSFSEITFDVTAMTTLADELGAGVRVVGAIPTDADSRAIVAGRIEWRLHRVEVVAEAQVGVIGDPVRLRGIVATAMHF